MPVMSVRFSDKEVRLIQRLAREEHKEKSSEARDLILEGLKYKMLVAYKQGEISLGTLAKKLGMPLTDTFDLLASLGVPAPISYVDHLQGLETAQALFRKES
jgi:hypothetical protein